MVADVEFKSLQLCLPIGYGRPRQGRFAGPMTLGQYKPGTTPAMAAPLDLTGRDAWSYHASGARPETRTVLAARYCPDSLQLPFDKGSVAASWNYPDLMCSQYQHCSTQPQWRPNNSVPSEWNDDGEALSASASHGTDQCPQNHRRKRHCTSSEISIALIPIQLISNGQISLPTVMNLSIPVVTRIRTSVLAH